MRFNEKYIGAPSAYTQTASVKASEPTKAKYAVQTLEYPAPPSQRKTIIKGIKKALKRTGKNPPSPTFKGSFLSFLPTMYVMSAAKSVAREPIKTS